MLFHTNPNVKSICHRIGVANVCFSTGFALQGLKGRSSREVVIRTSRKANGERRVLAI